METLLSESSKSFHKLLWLSSCLTFSTPSYPIVEAHRFDSSIVYPLFCGNNCSSFVVGSSQSSKLSYVLQASKNEPHMASVYDSNCYVISWYASLINVLTSARLNAWTMSLSPMLPCQDEYYSMGYQLVYILVLCENSLASKIHFFWTRIMLLGKINMT